MQQVIARQVAVDPRFQVKTMPNLSLLAITFELSDEYKRFPVSCRYAAVQYVGVSS